MSKFESLLSQYGEDHQNRLNKLLHYPCVPLIYVTAVGLLWILKLGELHIGSIQVNAAMIIAPIIMAYYVRMNIKIALGMMVVTLFSFWFAHTLEVAVGKDLWIYMLVINVVSWIVQFIGHAIEGKKPSSAKGLQFTLVGPAWVVAEIYKIFGIKY